MLEVRERGFAISEQEFEEGINAVAAPIFSSKSKPIASVSIAGPAYRLTRDRMMEIGSEIMIAAHFIAQEVERVTSPENYFLVVCQIIKGMLFKPRVDLLLTHSISSTAHFTHFAGLEAIAGRTIHVQIPFGGMILPVMLAFFGFGCFWQMLSDSHGGS